VSWTLRPAGVEHADAIGQLMHESFRGYLTFATPGWEPPAAEDEAGYLLERLGHPDVWCRVAEADGELVGQVAFQPATMAHAASDEPGLAHLWMLFVRPSHWGTGLASELHAGAVHEAAARGFSAMRLFAAAGQTRARRFYEREGWTAAGEPFEDHDIGLTVVEYRRAL
jgi:ribosomal protein S18 acetylase RimI-like enzyme